MGPHTLHDSSLRRAPLVWQHFEVLETGQKVPLRLDGVALAARVSLSAGAFNFGDCIMYDHREAKLVLTNRQDVPYAYSLVPPAHFDAAPLKGKIGPMGTAEVILTFKPHQVGLLSGSIKLLGFDGKVATQLIPVGDELKEKSFEDVQADG